MPPTSPLARIDRAAREIPAAPETIYAALTDRDAIGAWLPPDGMHGEMLAFDPRPGGAFRMVLHYDDATAAPGKTDAQSDRVEGSFVALERNSSIVQAFRFVLRRPGLMRMTWTLESARDGTWVTVTATDVPQGIAPADHEAGLNASLANLAAYIARDGSARG